ncbi:unnamed protein product [Protopolystoma xenopodis]|uniref:Large ribosomal subunit protein uL29m n=1 Tax=Protopolystoma xenopodis TaxID=117903 RepID=A0A3S5B3K5_9PLAT|nr:unnamed protein product [Protopolystoma xenopodis]
MLRAICLRFPQPLLFFKLNPLLSTFVPRSLYGTSNKGYNLLKFFELPKFSGEISVHAGRPWRKDELRLKSSQELHKLWYILLRELNMLMTMDTEHERRVERMPSGERLEKVEESMENLLDVVGERNKSIHELEHGSWEGPRIFHRIDALGRESTSLSEEHSYLESVSSKDYSLCNDKMFGDWTLDFIKLEHANNVLKKRSKFRTHKFLRRLQKFQRTNYIAHGLWHHRRSIP